MKRFVYAGRSFCTGSSRQDRSRDDERANQERLALFYCEGMNANLCTSSSSAGFEGIKLAVFYQFQAEGHMPREELENITDSPSEFNASSDKVFLCQIQSGSMGINLATADALVFININFSFVQYWQARARAQALERIEPSKVYWIFSEGGIEEKILDCVLKKRDYTDYYFRKDYGIRHSSKNSQMAESTAGHLRRKDGTRQPLRAA